MHPWDVSAEEAIAIQRRLRAHLSLRNTVSLDTLKTIAGVDASYKDNGLAVVIVFSFPDLHMLDQAIVSRPSTFPYIPGLLSFREAPLVVDAMRKLTIQPELLMADGQGYAHPRRLGLASHLGVYLDLPSIGCAKSRLIGRYTEPGPNIGDRSPLTDRGETIGTVLRSKPRTNPLFISAGHKIDLDTAVAVVLACLRGYRLPEPTRLADKLTKSTTLPPPS
jgi:deoxyribonuclease V